MIHFFPTFSRDAANTPYGDALRRSGVPHRIIASGLRIQYRNRLGLIFRVIPRLAFTALRSAFISLSSSQPAPNVVVVGSDIEVLVFAIVRLLLRRGSVRIVLSSFIFTLRSKRYLDYIRKWYFRFVICCANLIIVHSQLEVERYSRLFGTSRARFVFIPWATHITGRDALLEAARAMPSNGAVLTAGKSGRDYRALFEAMVGVDAELRVVCDYAGAIPRVRPSDRVTILTNCHSWDYFQEVIHSAVVVVPLAVKDISAGQMVVIQAMGLAKAIVVTDTPTIRDYVTDGHDVLLVPLGDVVAMRSAIQKLLGDETLRARLASNAKVTFDTNLTTEGHMQRLLSAIGNLG